MLYSCAYNLYKGVGKKKVSPSKKKTKKQKTKPPTPKDSDLVEISFRADGVNMEGIDVYLPARTMNEQERARHRMPKRKQGEESKNELLMQDDEEVWHNSEHNNMEGKDVWYGASEEASMDAKNDNE